MWDASARALAGERRPRARLGWVDAVRGAAVVLMVVDHVLLQVDPGSWLRFTLTRAALPLFMVAAAAVWRGFSWRRLAAVAVAAIVEWPLTVALGMSAPGIVAVFLLVSCVLWSSPWLVHRPGLLAGLGLIQALYLPVPWAGYQPGLVAAWWALGRLAGDELRAVFEWPPSFWLMWIGRRPMRWYLGHLAAIYAVVVLV